MNIQLIVFVVCISALSLIIAFVCGSIHGSSKIVQELTGEQDFHPELK